MDAGRYPERIPVGEHLEVVWDEKRGCIDVLARGKAVEVGVGAFSQWEVRENVPVIAGEVAAWTAGDYDTSLVDGKGGKFSVANALRVLELLRLLHVDDFAAVLVRELRRLMKSGTKDTQKYIMSWYVRDLDPDDIRDVFVGLNVQEQARVVGHLEVGMAPERFAEIHAIHFPRRYPVRFAVNEHVTVAYDAVTSGQSRHSTADEIAILVDGEPVFDSDCHLTLVLKPPKGYSTKDTIEGQADDARYDDIDYAWWNEDELVAAHASNVQAWVENDYDPALLYSKIAIPLLKALADIGDEKAASVLAYYEQKTSY